MNKSREDLKLMRISKETWEILKSQKKIQKKSMAQIVDDMVEKEYSLESKYGIDHGSPVEEVIEYLESKGLQSLANTLRTAKKQ